MYTFKIKVKTVILQVGRFLNPIVPPLIWNLLRSLYLHVSHQEKDVRYQQVTVHTFLHELHNGRFSEIHEKFSSLDRHLNFNTNTTRLRLYTLCTWGKAAILNTQNGDFLTAGISYGTSALVLSEYLNLENSNRIQYFIDPMDGRGRDNYNTSKSLVESRWNSLIPLIWFEELLSTATIEKIGPLAFVHLNTGDWKSELECIPNLYRKIVKGGVIVLDNYGWQTREDQLMLNNELDKLGANYFEAPTLQLIIF
jgi:hypothetical protein